MVESVQNIPDGVFKPVEHIERNRYCKQEPRRQNPRDDTASNNRRCQTDCLHLLMSMDVLVVDNPVINLGIVAHEYKRIYRYCVEALKGDDAVLNYFHNLFVIIATIHLEH